MYEKTLNFDRKSTCKDNILTELELIYKEIKLGLNDLENNRVFDYKKIRSEFIRKL